MKCDQCVDVERICLAFTTLTILASHAHAGHPKQAIQPEGSAAPFEFVAKRPTQTTRGYAFARQVIQAQPTAAVAATGPAARAASRIIYLNHEGALLRPGENQSSRDQSSIAARPTRITPWLVDDDVWEETVDCVAELYARFDVTVTDQDPGDTPHIEAVLGGHPADVGLPNEVAGVSPFTTDCGVIESSIVFTFTDVLPDDPRLICEITAQEIAHSYGLDHEMLPEDPMTYLDYAGDRSFQDEMTACGEYEDRPCGINGSVCRTRQNSVALLTQRLGARTTGPSRPTPGTDPTDEQPMLGGCTTAGSSTGGAMALALLGTLRRRRRH